MFISGAMKFFFNALPSQDRTMKIRSHISCFLLFILAFLMASVGSTTVKSQKTKPGWFWNQPVDCGMTAIGLARHSTMYPENSRLKAHENGIHTYLLQENSIHSGGHAFSITERGAVWLGSDHRETYDDSRFEYMMENLPVLDYQVSGNLTMVIVGPESCSEEVANRSRQYPRKNRPEWVGRTPEENSGMMYAVGVSQGYYYSESSWNEAELNARKNLSAAISTKVWGLQVRQNGWDQELIYSDLEITLEQAVVKSRYIDPSTNLYYVLVRMPAR